MKIQDTNISLYYALCAFILAIGFATMGVGQAENLSWLLGFIFWFLHTATAMYLYTQTSKFFSSFVRNKPLQGFLISSILGSLIFGIVAIFLEIPFFETQINLSTLVKEMPIASIQSLIFWMMINVPFLLEQVTLKDKKSQSEVENKEDKIELQENVQKEVTPFMNYISKLDKQTPLIMIKSEANYIRLFYKDSSHLFLYTLKDAITELGHGLQPHRSYWVNQEQVNKRFYKNKSPFILMEEGFEVPIGRKYFKSIKDILK